MKCDIENCTRPGRYEDVEEFYCLCEHHYEQAITGVVYDQ